MAYFEQVKLADANGSPINAATETTLSSVDSKLSTVDTSVQAVDTSVQAVNTSIQNVTSELSSGEMLQAIESLRMAVNSLTRSVGLMTFDTTSSARVRIANIDGGLTLTNVTTLNQLGAYSSNSLIQDFGHFSADNLRRNISVT